MPRKLEPNVCQSTAEACRGAGSQTSFDLSWDHIQVCDLGLRVLPDIYYTAVGRRLNVYLKGLLFGLTIGERFYISYLEMT